MPQLGPIIWDVRVNVIPWVAIDLWRRKPTLSSGYALELDWFTPWPCVLYLQPRVYNRREGKVSHSVYGSVCHPCLKFMTFHWCCTSVKTASACVLKTASARRTCDAIILYSYYVVCTVCACMMSTSATTV